MWKRKGGRPPSVYAIFKQYVVALLEIMYMYISKQKLKCFYNTPKMGTSAEAHT